MTILKIPEIFLYFFFVEKVIMFLYFVKKKFGSEV